MHAAGRPPGLPAALPDVWSLARLPGLRVGVRVMWSGGALPAAAPALGMPARAARPVACTAVLGCAPAELHAASCCACCACCAHQANAEHFGPELPFLEGGTKRVLYPASNKASSELQVGHALAVRRACRHGRRAGNHAGQATMQAGRQAVRQAATAPLEPSLCGTGVGQPRPTPAHAMSRMQPQRAHTHTHTHTHTLPPPQHAPPPSSPLLQSDLAARGFDMVCLNIYETVPVTRLDERQLAAARRAAVVTVGSPSAMLVWA